MAHSVISGGRGFLGSHLSQKLLLSGQKVTVLPRELLHSPVGLRDFLIVTNPDYIYHLASYGNKYSQTEEEEIFKANVVGTFNLLKASIDLPYKGFINVGSSSEYGRKNHPMKETDGLDTDTFYGVTKVSAFLLSKAFARKYKRPIVTVRPFSVYGPNDDPSKFIQTAINCFKEDKTLTLANGVHDWIYVDDFISGLTVVADHASEFMGEAVNIGCGVQYSNEEIIGFLEDIFNKSIDITPIEKLRSYDTKAMWLADITRIKKLGWKPTVSLKEGLERIINAKD